MSEENEEANEANEANEAAAETTTAPTTSKPKPSGSGPQLLSKPTDYVERPGFRNPSNRRSKASKKKRRKKS